MKEFESIHFVLRGTIVFVLLLIADILYYTSTACTSILFACHNHQVVGTSVAQSKHSTSDKPSCTDYWIKTKMKEYNDNLKSNVNTVGLNRQATTDQAPLKFSECKVSCAGTLGVELLTEKE